MGAMEHFARMASGEGRLAELQGEKRPVVGVFCNFVPEELVWAAGAIPIRLDAGDAEAATEAEAVLPQEACPVARSAVGVLRASPALHELLRLLVIPTPCDAKRKLALSAGLGVPAHVLPIPAEKDSPTGRAAWLAEVRRLQEALTKLTGKAVTRQSLRAAIEVTNARQRAFREVLELRKSSPPRLTGAELLTVVQASFWDDPRRHAEAMLALVQERKAATPQPAGKRVLLTGAPVIAPNTRLVEVIEEAGLHIVADDLCSGTERLYHPVQPMEWTVPEMLLASAEHALLPCTCPCFASHEDRVNRLVGLAEEYAIDGLVYHNLRACVLFQFETSAVRETFRERGTPVLEISTDYGAQDLEQMRTRVQAFAEMLGG